MYSNFKALEKDYSGLWQRGELNEALKLIQLARDKFPEEDFTTQLDLAAIYMHLDQIDKTKEVLEDGFSKNYVYPQGYFQGLKEQDTFKDLFKDWDKRLEKLNEEAETGYEVILPRNFDEHKAYPLFMAIHGWGEDVEFFKNYWHAKSLSENYILVFAASSQRIGTKHYCWTDREVALRDITNIYEQINKHYKILQSPIVVGGFSQGGTLALDLALNDKFPNMKAFISLCPQKPENFTEDRVKSAMGQGIKGCIITGDQDPSYPEQKEIIEVFKSHDLQYDFFVEKGLGHWFPENLSDTIDEALAFVEK